MAGFILCFRVLGYHLSVTVMFRYFISCQTKKEQRIFQSPMWLKKGLIFASLAMQKLIARKKMETGQRNELTMNLVLNAKIAPIITTHIIVIHCLFFYVNWIIWTFIIFNWGKIISINVITNQTVMKIVLCSYFLSVQLWRVHNNTKK